MRDSEDGQLCEGAESGKVSHIVLHQAGVSRKKENVGLGGVRARGGEIEGFERWEVCGEEEWKWGRDGGRHPRGFCGVGEWR